MANSLLGGEGNFCAWTTHGEAATAVTHGEMRAPGQDASSRMSISSMLVCSAVVGANLKTEDTTPSTIPVVMAGRN